MLQIIKDLHKSLRIPMETGRVVPSRPDISIDCEGPSEIWKDCAAYEYRIQMVLGRILACKPKDYDKLVGDIIASLHDYIYGEILDDLRKVRIELHADGHYNERAVDMLHQLIEKVGDRGPRA